MVFYGRLGKRIEKIRDKIRLQMVQFECPRYGNPYVSITFKEFLFPIFSPFSLSSILQGGWGGWPTGNGKKLSSCQAQLGQATRLAVA